MLTCFTQTQAVQKSAEWQVGVYVRVHGNVSEFNNDWRVQAFNVRAITDFNEVCGTCSFALYPCTYI